MSFSISRALLAGSVMAGLASLAGADEFSEPVLQPSYYSFGGVGLIQSPTARMASEGDFSVGFSMSPEYRFVTANVQLFPWLESTIRYTLVPSVPYSVNDPDPTWFADKGIDVKVRLWEESTYLPDVSLGLRDIGGTGLFDGEYLVATKRWGDFDFTAGVGWGYLGQANDAQADRGSDNHCGREMSISGMSGQFDYQRFFTGCMAVFGGVEYQAPWAPLRLKLEYEGNDYSGDFAVVRGGEDMTQRTRFNFAAHYRVNDWLDARLAFERGNTATLGLYFVQSYQTSPVIAQPNPVPQYTRNTQNEVDYDVLAAQLGDVAGYQVQRMAEYQNELRVYARQVDYRELDEAQLRASYVLENLAPQYEGYRLIDAANGMSLVETSIDVEVYQEVASNSRPGVEFDEAVSRSNPQPALQERALWHKSSPYYYGWDVDLNQSFGSREGFINFNLALVGYAGVFVTDTTKLAAAATYSLYDNFDEFEYVYPPDATTVKRVRTLVRQYLAESPLAVHNIYGAQYYSPAAGHYMVGYAGYLERMFGGVGGEYLYRPLDANWAFGIDVNYVAQRDPENQWQFLEDRDYLDEYGNTYQVQAGGITGHATLYYQPEFELLDNTLLQISVGQYLAEDRGITLDFSKQFDSGVIFGAYATKTDLSAEEFGEGSFAKGFYFSIPLDLIRQSPSNGRGVFRWDPLTRDGGSRLARPERLYQMTDVRSPWFGRPPR